MKPQYLIVAGINGAGKSTLYEVERDLFADTYRINADEILRRNHGDWHNRSDNLTAMRQELKAIHTSLAQQRSIHVETTLAGTGHAQRDLIAEAHNQAYDVTLLYVTLQNDLLAIDRVQQRVAKGGHGISTSLIKKRYQQSLVNFKKIAVLCDNLIIYDNTDGMRLVYQQSAQQVKVDRRNEFPWLQILTAELPNQQPNKY